MMPAGNRDGLSAGRAWRAEDRYDRTRKPQSQRRFVAVSVVPEAQPSVLEQRR
jgi:hypothetical protein